jgi:radical SAM superfamily enzyme YgiQ (UPF0313 family)
MRHIILVRPQNDVSALGIPLGLLRIGTMLEAAGYQVKIIDYSMEDDAQLCLYHELSHDVLFVGISCLTSEIASAIQISDFIKRISDVPVVWGGCHPTLFPEETCADKSVDYVCIGEGDKTIVELAQAIENGSSATGICGLGYKTIDKVIINPQTSYVDLEELPPINYDLIDMSQYIKSRGGIRSIPYQSSRGCPHHCGFCINLAIRNQKYRVKSPEKVATEIVGLIDKYGVNYINFYDDNFFVNIQRVTGISKLIKRLNIQWFAECRVDYFHDDLVDIKLLKFCQSSGLSQLTLGAESGSQRMLDSIGKDITIEQILHSAEELSHFNIVPNYSFIVGLPDETKGEQIMTVDLARTVYKICPSSLCHFVTYTPYPKTAITDKLIDNGQIKQPKLLRDWLKNDVRSLYYDRFSSKPWHEDKKFIDNVVFYARTAYALYSSGEIKWKNIVNRPFRYRGIIFVLLAQRRIESMNFKFPIDKWLFSFMLKINEWVVKWT